MNTNSLVISTNNQANDVVLSSNNSENMFDINASSSQKPSDKLNKQTAIEQILIVGDLLTEQHATYKEEYLTRGNKALYDLLTSIYDFAIQIDDSLLKDKIVDQMRKTLKEKHNVKTTVNTPWLTTVIKYVIKTDRQTASNYSRVLRVAFEEDVAVDELSNFIESRGGINKVHTTEAEIAAKKAKQEEADLRFDLHLRLICARAQISTKTINYRKEQILNVNPYNPGGYSVFFTVYDYKTNCYKISFSAIFDMDFEDQIIRYLSNKNDIPIEELESHVQRIEAIADKKASNNPMISYIPEANAA